MQQGDKKKVIGGLDGLVEKKPELSEVIILQTDLLNARPNENILDGAPATTVNALHSRLHQGIPFLVAQETALDWEVFAQRFRQVCRITATHRPDLLEQLQALELLIDTDPDRIRSVTIRYLDSAKAEETDSPVQTSNAAKSEPSELLTFVLLHTLRPSLEAFARARAAELQEQLGAEWNKPWQRGNCPICGGAPDLAYLDEESGARHLVCSRCDSQWPFPRIKCPFCGSAEPSHQSYYDSDDNVHRVYVCQNCRRYLKAVDLRRTHRPFVIPVERVATIDLDVAARQAGYH